MTFRENEADKVEQKLLSSQIKISFVVCTNNKRQLAGLYSKKFYGVIITSVL
jgi:hypothetical protein